ncbi:MAG: hypothetical protein DRP99_05150 [Candidatus Latescibacterota bacterium]|nr:MAG: hypothetical protein DRP99_05150 [Candidatus Latescibacterota bacterium]
MARKLFAALMLLATMSSSEARVTVDVREKLRRMEIELVERFGWGPERTGILAKPGLRPSLGTKRTFWAYDFASERFYQVEATCRGVGEHCYIFVEDANWNTRVRREDVEALLTAFDRRTPAHPDSGIYLVDKDVFGEPPDVDGDPKVYILVLDIKDDLGEGLYVGGYFSGVNEYSDREARQRGYRSNETEILYIDCDPLDLSSSGSHRVLAHEFQHMIHFNMDPEEETWLNEGCSTFAEFINGYGVRLPENFKDHPEDSLVEWEGKPIDYEQVGMFVDYLYEHFGGMEIVRSLVADPKHGVRGVTSTLHRMGYDEGFDEVFEGWVLANYLDDPRPGEMYYYENYELSGAYDFSDTKVYLSYPAEGRGSVGYTSTNYVSFSDVRDLHIEFDGEDRGDFRAFVILFPEEGPPQVDEVPLDERNDGCWSFYGRYDKIVLVPVVRDLPTGIRVSYLYSAREMERGVVSVYPYPGATGVPLDAKLRVTFSSPYDPTSLKVDFGLYPAGKRLRSKDGRTLTVLPSEDLSPYTTYTIRIRAGVKDLAGEVLLRDDYSWSFTTGAGAEATELAYDDGNYDLWLYWEEEGEGSGVRFTPPYVPARLLSARFYVADVTFGRTFWVRVFEDDGEGYPGRELTEPIKVEAPGVGWFHINLEDKDIVVDGDFHVMFQIYVVVDTLKAGPGFLVTEKRLSSPYFGAEDHPPISGRSWDLFRPFPFSERLVYRKANYDYGIRAVVAPVSQPTDTQETSPSPERFILSQNRPNPFNTFTLIPYSIPTPCRVTLDVLDLRGRRIKRLVDGEMPAGEHGTLWDGRDELGREVASGVYICRLRSGGRTLVRKMVLVR